MEVAVTAAKEEVVVVGKAAVAVVEAGDLAATEVVYSVALVSNFLTFLRFKLSKSRVVY